jgi:hypothetical protein
MVCDISHPRNFEKPLSVYLNKGSLTNVFRMILALNRRLSVGTLLCHNRFCSSSLLLILHLYSFRSFITYHIFFAFDKTIVRYGKL